MSSNARINREIPATKRTGACVWRLRVNWIGVPEVSRCKHHGFLVENLRRGNSGALGGQEYCLRESPANQVNEQGTPIPALECWPPKVHVVDFDSLRDDLLCQAFQK